MFLVEVDPTKRASEVQLGPITTIARCSLTQTFPEQLKKFSSVWTVWELQDVPLYKQHHSVTLHSAHLMWNIFVLYFFSKVFQNKKSFTLINSIAIRN